jgi:hypothetical protein
VNLHLARLACLGVMLSIVTWAGCSDSASAVRPAIPTIRAQQGVGTNGCYNWSCAYGDCQFDPAVYGACCLQMADSIHPAYSKPSCGDPNPNDPNNDCTPGTNFSGPYDGTGWCDFQYACCYNPGGA